MEDPRVFTSTVTHTMVDDRGKVWEKSTVSWENSSQGEAVGIQDLMVKMLAQTVRMGYEAAGEEGRKVKDLVHSTVED